MLADLRWRSLAKGAASFFLPSFRSSWHAQERYVPEFFYQIFLRHFQHASPHMNATAGYHLAELGPGDTVGAGLAALISGAERYTALDVENILDVERNLTTFDRLVELFQARTPLSNAASFADLFPYAVSETFPAAIEENLSWSMAPERLAAIRADVKEQSGKYVSVSVPWEKQVLPPASVDWLMTHAVLEHIDLVEPAYECFQTWLRTGGVMTHMIDFFSHGLTSTWNGHWCINDLTWALIRGRRHYLINRLPLSSHLAYLNKYGFEICEQLNHSAEGGRDRKCFARRFRNIPELDAHTRMVFLVCKALPN